MGSGHVMRCLCLADGLAQKGASVSFVSRALPEHLAALIVAHGHSVTRLTSQASMDEERDAQQTIAAVDPADLIILDHYGLGYSWEVALRGHGQLLVIDDLARPHHCDWLLDQNFHQNADERYDGQVPPDCRRLLGPQYALLRDEFHNQRKRISPREGPVRHLLVFLGGMDADNVTSKVLAAIDRVPCDPLSVDVVIGPTHSARESIAHWCETRPNTSLHIGVNNMAELFARADLAIGAGGSTTWERCTLGLPTFALCLADNQRELLEQGARAGFVYAPEIAIGNIDAIALHLQALIDHAGLRNHLSVTGMTLVDGLGCDRVVAALKPSEIVLRQATMDDADQLLEWRNQPLVRAASRETGVIDSTIHRSWLTSVLRDPDRFLLIGEYSGEDIGVLRFDRTGEEAEVSIYLAPGQNGRGFGLALMKAGEAWLRHHEPRILNLLAVVQDGNRASQNLFDRAGYEKQSIHYKKRI
jgi:UDP-2,4-diacetamido-2,4,6-trideoxy-beta-L-altropyranose hydrolase